MTITQSDVELLEQVWQLLDNLSDGAPDASHSAKTANLLEDKLGRLIDKLSYCRKCGAQLTDADRIEQQGCTQCKGPIP